jgi:hypothetical protein
VLLMEMGGGLKGDIFRMRSGQSAQEGMAPRKLIS